MGAVPPLAAHKDVSYRSLVSAMDFSNCPLSSWPYSSVNDTFGSFATRLLGGGGGGGCLFVFLNRWCFDGTVGALVQSATTAMLSTYRGASLRQNGVGFVPVGFVLFVVWADAKMPPDIKDCVPQTSENDGNGEWS